MADREWPLMSRAARMCPICAEDSKVIDSREAADGMIRRKRRCTACGTCFITVEGFAGMVPAKRPSRSRAQKAR